MGVGSWSYAQVLTIQDQVSGQVLEGVTLSSSSPRAFTSTNHQGQADISIFKGAAKIHIRLGSYKTEVRSYQEFVRANLSLKLRPEAISLDQVVVAATRWNQNNREVPALITRITPQEVALQNPQTTADLLATSGKVFIQKSQQGGGSPMIRGFATNRLLYTVDGVRMNTAIFRSGNIQNVISLDPLAIENTEVYFGPGSLIYGSDAIGGVMSFQTLTPQLSLAEARLVTGKALMRYSSANQEKTGHFDVNLGWRKWGLVTSFTSSDFGDLKMGRHGPEEYLRPFFVRRQDSTDRILTNEDPLLQKPSGYSQMNFMQKIRFQPAKNWDLQYGFHYSTTSNYSRYDRLIRTRNGLPRSAEWYYGPQMWLMNNFSVAYTGNNSVYDQFTLRLAHQAFEESRIDRDFNDAERRRREEKVIAWSVNADFLKNLGHRHTLYYGAEVVRNDVASTGTNQNIVTATTSLGPSRYPQAIWSSYGAYVNHQFRVSESVLTQAGLRYNRYDLKADFSKNLPFYPFPFSTAKLNNGALTGSVGLVFTPTSDWTISGNVATGFRSPNVDDVGKVFDSTTGSDTELGSVVVPNPALQAEYAANGEIGLAKLFGESLKVDLTGYFTHLKNALVRRDFTLNGQSTILYNGQESNVQAIQNAAQAQVFGVQGSLEGKLPNGWGLSSQFNYQQGEEELDNGSTSPLRHAAPWFGISRITYRNSKLNLQLYAHYSGKVSYQNLSEDSKENAFIYASDADGNPYSPGWYTLNYKALYQLNNMLTISAGVENLTDRRYRPYSSGIVASGRNFSISLRVNF